VKNRHDTRATTRGGDQSARQAARQRISEPERSEVIDDPDRRGKTPTATITEAITKVARTRVEGRSDSGGQRRGSNGRTISMAARLSTRGARGAPRQRAHGRRSRSAARTGARLSSPWPRPRDSRVLVRPRDPVSPRAATDMWRDLGARDQRADRLGAPGESEEPSSGPGACHSAVSSRPANESFERTSMRAAWSRSTVGRRHRAGSTTPAGRRRGAAQRASSGGEGAPNGGPQSRRARRPSGRTEVGIAIRRR